MSIEKEAMKQVRNPCDNSIVGCITGRESLRVKRQIGDMRGNTLYTFGESTIEVDMPKSPDGSFPFERVTKDT